MSFQEPLMKKRMTIMVITLLVIFGGIIAFNLIKGWAIKRYLAHMGSPSVTVASVTAIQRDWHPRIHAVGNFIAINGVDVNAQASGNVVAIHFKSGQYIEKDKPLIDLDDRVEQATLKFNQAELFLQEINYKRQTDLFTRNATPKSSVDEAHAKLLQSQANVEKTQTLIQQKHVVAPFSGQVGIRQIDLGQYITTGQTSIVTLQSMDPLYLQFYLPEQLLTDLQLNQNITFSAQQYPGVQFKGKITAINAKVDTNTHTIKVQATLPNCSKAALQKNTHAILHCDSALNTKNNVTDFIFIPGMFAAIEVEQPSVPNAIVLPSTSISYSLYGNSVFVIEKDTTAQDGEKDGDTLHVKRVFVSTGAQQGNDTVITKGIKPGQVVVASGELKLEDGTPVTINNNVPLNGIKNPDQLGQ